MDKYKATIKFMNFVNKDCRFTHVIKDYDPVKIMIKPDAPDDQWNKECISHVDPDWRYHWSLNVDLDLVEKVKKQFQRHLTPSQIRSNISNIFEEYVKNNKPKAVYCRHKFGDIVKTETKIFAKCIKCEYSTTVYASKQNWNKG